MAENIFTPLFFFCGMVGRSLQEEEEAADEVLCSRGSVLSVQGCSTVVA